MTGAAPSVIYNTSYIITQKKVFVDKLLIVSCRIHLFHI